MKIAVACVEMRPETSRRQPWFYMQAIAHALVAGGHQVTILTNRPARSNEGPAMLVIPQFRSFPAGIAPELGQLLEKHRFDKIFWATGLSDFWFRRQIDRLVIPVVAVMTCRRYSLTDLARLPGDLLGNFHLTKSLWLGTALSRRRIADFWDHPNLERVVFQCRETRNSYLLSGDSAKAIVISPPLPQPFTAALTTGLSRDRVPLRRRGKIVYYGPPLSLRGLDTTLAAMAILVRQGGPAARLTILARIDAAHHRRKLSRQIDRYRLRDQVEISTEILPAATLVEHLLSAEIICLPFKIVISDMPIVVIEALAGGATVITTQVAGGADYVHYPNCHLVPANAPLRLAAMIARILAIGAPTKGIGQQLVDEHHPRIFAAQVQRLVNEP